MGSKNATSTWFPDLARQKLTTSEADGGIPQLQRSPHDWGTMGVDKGFFGSLP
jgi:hypothetical protein